METIPDLTAEIEACRARLEADLLDEAAAHRLRAAVAAAIAGRSFAPSPVLAALAEATGVLNGAAAWRDGDETRGPAALSAEVYEALVIHPREKQERQHQF